MKLNEFLTKTNKPLPKRTQTIAFVNETKEIELNSQISTLETEVQRLHDMEDRYTKMLSRVEVFEEHTKNSQFREDQLNEKISVLVADVQRGEQMKQERDEIEESLKSFKSQYNAQENTLDLAQKANASLSNDCQKFQSQITGLLDENVQLLDLSQTATQQSVDNKNELNDIKSQLTEIAKVFSSSEVKYKQETKKNSELSRDLSHWQRVANTLQEEKDDLEKTRTMLQAWAEAVDADYQNSTEIGRVNKSEIQKLRKAVSTMNEQLAELIDENKYLSQENSSFRDELARPKYVSASSIERAEGFKMPRGGHVKGKNWLGNGTPTLISFKREAEDGK
tara:strand:+ start:1018 stop:2028 length:1011 start_codon:yes stop_codon:yes gene_type:complete